MPPKTKPAAKTAKAARAGKAAVKKPAVKAAAAARKPAPATRKRNPAEGSGKPAAKKVSSKANVRKNPEGLIDAMKKGLQTGIDAVGDLVKKITPEALKPKAKKLKRM